MSLSVVLEAFFLSLAILVQSPGPGPGPARAQGDSAVAHSPNRLSTPTPSFAHLPDNLNHTGVPSQLRSVAPSISPL